MCQYEIGITHLLSCKPQSNLRISEAIKEETTEIKTNTHLFILITILDYKSLVLKNYF